MFRNTIVCIIDALDISAVIEISKKCYVTKMSKTKVPDLAYGPGPLFWTFLSRIIFY